MSVKIGNAPCSWGVRPVDDPERPGWRDFLRECADSGYSGVELGPVGYMTELPPPVLAEALDANGLKMVAAVVYQPLSDPAKWDVVQNAAVRLCRAAAAQGAKHLVVIDSVSPRRQSTTGREPEAEQMDKAEWTAFRSRIETIAQMAADEYGLTACVHQHVGGFLEFESEFERLLEEVDAALLKICLDTGHYMYAGHDPVAFLRRHLDRISYLHFKDVNPVVLAEVVANRTGFFDAHGKGVFCRLGEGGVAFPEISNLLVESGYDGWCTVEQDADPMVGLNPREDAVRSRAYLRSIGFN